MRSLSAISAFWHCVKRGKTYREIGEMLGISSSRVGQIHARASNPRTKRLHAAPFTISRGMSVEELPLSLRAALVLRLDGYEVIGELLDQDRETLLKALLRVPNAARKTVQEIHGVLNMIEPVTNEALEPAAQSFQARNGSAWTGPWRETMNEAVDDAVEAGGAIRGDRDGEPFFKSGWRVSRRSARDR
jgi:hypothetical protein